MATLSSFDKTGQAYERGNKAEDRFESALKKRFPGKRAARANSSEEKYDHWDYKLCVDASCDSAKALKYEVKGVRKLEMRDQAPQDKLFPVEFLSVDGHPGWVFGKANFIAFETLGEEWIVVKPTDLAAMAVNKIKEAAAKRGIVVNNVDEILSNPSLRVNRSPEALYKIYGRAGRGDALTWVRREDILALPHEIWKPGETGTVAEPASIRVITKRGQMGPGGKPLMTSDVSVWQGSKLIATIPLQGRWDQAKVEETLKGSIPANKWSAEEIINQLRTNPMFVGQVSPTPPTGGFKEWVIWHERTIRRSQ